MGNNTDTRQIQLPNFLNDINYANILSTYTSPSGNSTGRFQASWARSLRSTTTMPTSTRTRPLVPSTTVAISLLRTSEPPRCVVKRLSGPPHPCLPCPSLRAIR